MLRQRDVAWLVAVQTASDDADGDGLGRSLDVELDIGLYPLVSNLTGIARLGRTFLCSRQGIARNPMGYRCVSDPYRVLVA
jgi:hypothetical protein